MKSYKPYTDSRRHMTTVTFKGKVTTNEPHKALTKGGKRDFGRNNAGRITVRHKAAGTSASSATSTLITKRWFRPW